MSPAPPTPIVVVCACGRNRVTSLRDVIASCGTPECDARVIAAAKKGHKTC